MQLQAYRKCCPRYSVHSSLTLRFLCCLARSWGGTVALHSVSGLASCLLRPLIFISKATSPTMSQHCMCPSCTTSLRSPQSSVGPSSCQIPGDYGSCWVKSNRGCLVLRSMYLFSLTVEHCADVFPCRRIAVTALAILTMNLTVYLFTYATSLCRVSPC